MALNCCTFFFADSIKTQIEQHRVRRSMQGSVIKILRIVCVRSCDQKPYLHNETKGVICIKIEFNPQKNISLLKDGRRFVVYSSNMAAVTSCEHTLYLFVLFSPPKSSAYYNQSVFFILIL